MTMSDYLSQMGITATLAKAAQRDLVKNLLTDLVKDGRALQIDFDVDLVVDKYLDRVLESASTLQVASAVTGQLWQALIDKASASSRKETTS